MAKSNTIKKVVNGEIADADDINQIVEDAGNEGGGIAYDPSTHSRSTDGSQSLGSTAYPWGSLQVNQEAQLVEVDAVGHTAASSVAFKNLRRFLFLKDAPSTFVGSAGLTVRVNLAANALEFYQPSNFQKFASSGTFVCPAGITTVYISMVGGGGGSGGAGNFGSGGGGGGRSVIGVPYTVIPGNSYTVTIGAGGTGGTAGNPGTDGGDGGTSSFDGIIIANGGNHSAGSSNSAPSVGGAALAAKSMDASGTTPGTMGQFASGAGSSGASGGIAGAGGGTAFGVGGTGNTAGIANTGAGAGGATGSQNGKIGGSGSVIVGF